MLLHAHSISFSYGPRFSLEIESFHLAAGEVVGLIGANGSGKTTLMRILGGLLSPHTGSITVAADQNLLTMPQARRASLVAFVPQAHRPVFEFTVEQMVLVGTIPHRALWGGFEREEDLRAADQAIALLELEQLRHEPVTRLSGGELQRVVIARALAQQTPVLLLDEPNTHLDIGHQLDVLDTVRHEALRRGAGVIASIHDLNLASILCDRIVAMKDGRQIHDGHPSEVLRQDIIARIFDADMVVEANAYGDAPALRYRYHRHQRDDA